VSAHILSHDGIHRDDHRRALRAYFARRVRAVEEIEDHVQDVYVRVLTAGLEHQNVVSWRGVLLRVAGSVWIDRFRRDKARGRDQRVELHPDHELSDEGLLSPEAALLSSEKLERVEDALLELEPLCRHAFVLARFEGLAHKEIAARLGVAPVSVGRYIERALIHLARRTAELA
jgi:RNA polymerase sigma factor (sigma-70 family)